MTYRPHDMRKVDIDCVERFAQSRSGMAGVRHQSCQPVSSPWSRYERLLGGKKRPTRRKWNAACP